MKKNDLDSWQLHKIIDLPTPHPDPSVYNYGHYSLHCTSPSLSQSTPLVWSEFPIWALLLPLKHPMVRRQQNDLETPRFTSLILFFLALISFAVVYTFLSFIFRPNGHPLDAKFESFTVAEEGDQIGQCCQGIENLEFWGGAVKWGSDFKFNSSRMCCEACKAMCTGNDGPCLCDTWVFCGNKKSCGSRFGEVSCNFSAFLFNFDASECSVWNNFYSSQCWLKKQKDVLAPDRQDAGQKVMWTSGLIFGKGQVCTLCLVID